MPYLLHTRSEGHSEQPDQRDQSDRGKHGTPSFGLWTLDLGISGYRLTSWTELHFQNDGRGQTQRDRGEHLISDSEQRPQRIYSTQRIAHALNEKITPTRNHQSTRQHICREIF